MNIIICKREREREREFYFCRSLGIMFICWSKAISSFSSITSLFIDSLIFIASCNKKSLIISAAYQSCLHQCLPPSLSHYLNLFQFSSLPIIERLCNDNLPVQFLNSFCRLTCYFCKYMYVCTDTAWGCTMCCPVRVQSLMMIIVIITSLELYKSNHALTVNNRERRGC